MTSFRSDSAPNGLTADSGARSELGTSRLEAKSRLGWMRTLTLLAGLLAGLASFGVGEATYQIVPPSSSRRSATLARR